ncbi:MAG TPA: hypothetical protein VMF31_10075 [Solirubrobacterales bacterium]|nr:hypothetical protein [Solirubrobacterales bacterium]
MASLQKIEIGFEGGQVVPVRIDEAALEGLRTALKSGDGSHEISYEEGTLILDLGKVIFLRITSNATKVGF